MGGTWGCGVRCLCLLACLSRPVLHGTHLHSAWCSCTYGQGAHNSASDKLSHDSVRDLLLFQRAEHAIAHEHKMLCAAVAIECVRAGQGVHTYAERRCSLTLLGSHERNNHPRQGRRTR